MGIAFIWFTTHFGGGFASGAQLYSYFGKYGAWCLLSPYSDRNWSAEWLLYCLL
ncbi:MAG: hypothetical protein PUG60_13580 [Lachnospiraceae bacterium]|nr:hypothetical protein [Lachnospiraceae bacterium]MDY4970573.1 hypothetical protein [Lachnospiraceae bacterium]